MLSLPDRPTPDLCAAALAAAAETQTNEHRRRYVALEALQVLYPGISSTRLAIRLSFDKPSSASGLIATAKKREWWNDVDVDHVIGSLVAGQYGERAH